MEAVSIFVGISGSIVFMLLLVKLIQRSRTVPESAESGRESWSDEWFEEYSSFRYLPMRRLLCEEDETFFVRSNDDGAAMRSAFRAERRRLFCQYLRLIAADFHRLSEGLRMSIVHADQDRTAELQSLLRLEWTFRKLLFQARLRVALHWLGVPPIDATELIDALQSFEFGLREMRLGFERS